MGRTGLPRFAPPRLIYIGAVVSSATTMYFLSSRLAESRRKRKSKNPPSNNDHRPLARNLERSARVEVKLRLRYLEWLKQKKPQRPERIVQLLVFEVRTTKDRHGAPPDPP
jgi:hypothetical protein